MKKKSKRKKNFQNSNFSVTNPWNTYEYDRSWKLPRLLIFNRAISNFRNAGGNVFL